MVVIFSAVSQKPTYCHFIVSKFTSVMYSTCISSFRLLFYISF